MRRGILLLLIGTACSSGGGDFAPPETLDTDTYVLVDRTVENELMAEAVATLEELGLTEAFGAAYEFLENKPQLFLGMGKGTADRRAIMDAALPHFGGAAGPTEPPREVARAGATFLCAPYSHTGVPGTVGTGGLASISAVCTWSDGATSGFGVGVAGLSVEDVLKLTAEARDAVVMAAG